MLHRAFTDVSGAATTALVLFTLYAVPFVLLLRMIDYLEREPVRLQMRPCAGAAWSRPRPRSAAAPRCRTCWPSSARPRLAAAWGPAVSGAAVEELVKVAGVVAIALVAPGQINSVVDGFVYGALVGLGFQVVENFVFALNAVALEPARTRSGR